MVYDDYLIRMIRQGAAVLARIAGLKKSGDYQDALQEIHQNQELLFGMDPSLIRLSDDESLYSALSARVEGNPEQLELAADLFIEEGDILRRQGNAEESDAAYGRALLLLLRLAGRPDSSNTAAVSKKAGDVFGRMDPAGVPSALLFDLFCHFENAGEYKKAEAVLGRLSSRPDVRTDALRESRLFYRRMLDVDPGRLSAQGMSRKYLQGRLREIPG